MWFLLSWLFATPMIQGEADAAAVESVVNAQQPALGACHKKHRPKSSGEISVRFEIGSFGDVTSALTMATTFNHPRLEACVLGVFRALKFSPPEHGTIIVTYPIGFTDEPSSMPAIVKPTRLTQKTIKEVLADEHESFVACYAPIVKERQNLKGSELTVAFTIGKDGSPAGVELYSVHGVAEIDRCMLETTQKLKFARPRTAERAKIELPFVLWD